ncbi:Hypothetical predicted protein [Mytilus galloprovincialis]|uniref:Uncharacterized protein n=1 Tax=Mytilus galloprovincialis TaxID=29158 RepID=A0A8B6C7S8_MYTGA|nr:Hypothetical predicted protein [Mytilus galloprovincialis]
MYRQENPKLVNYVHTGIIPNERAFESKGSDPMSSIVCQYTDSPPKIRTLRKQGTNDALPNDASLCEPWDSAV